MATKRRSRGLRKLVRDMIPQEITREGRSVRRVQVLGSLRDVLLRRKALEEVVELCGAHGPESLKEELADVFEILHALADEHRISLDEIESIRIAKRAARGGFDKGVFIDYVSRGEPTSQIGLFGPMDYVSVTKRTPQVAEVRMDEETLLRIPLVPSLYREEFKVGKYVVTYTDREILVRIQTTADDKQLALFGPEPDFYDLAQSPDSLLELLPKFEGFWKIYSNVLLRAFGFPVPKSVVLRNLTPESEKAIRHFCARGGHKHLLVRHDRNPELDNPPRGGYLIAVDNLLRELTPFFAQGRILMLQEPLSPHSDLYSCNASLRKNSPHTSLEIVGPGFDASDLNRGDITPHETLTLSCDSGADLNLATAKRLSIVDHFEYQQSLRKRLVKIGRRVTGAFRVGARVAAGEKSEEQLIKSAKSFLRRQRETLLLENAERYTPLGETELSLFANILRELRSYVETEAFLWRDEIIVSMSLTPSNRLILWQIVWPERKAYARQNRK